MGPSARAAILGIGGGGAVAAYLTLATGWPTYVTIGVGAFVGLVLLVIAASLGDDPEAADAAWRDAAADLYRDEDA